MARSALSGEKTETELRRCPAHPLKKTRFLKENDSCAFCAAAAVLLTYRKILDDLADERGVKRLRAELAKPVFSRGRKRVLRQMPELLPLDGKIEKLLSELSEIEGKSIRSADLPAEVFGKILGEIGSFGFENEKKLTSYRFTAALGHWIYLADAADDLPEDIEKGRYNPLVALYGREMTYDDKSSLKTALIAKLMEAEAAFDLMDMSESPDADGIIKNVLYLGLPQVAEEALDNPGNKRKAVKERRPKGSCSNERSV